MKIKLNVPEYTPAQKKVFEDSTARRRIIQKGRRLGFTHGSAVYCILSMLAGTYKKILWGDVTLLNIRNYAERLFLPILEQLPNHIWSWHATDKKLQIKDAVIDFRSADQPENWEGFAYDLVILNEAGIILKNAYIWRNAVAPMLLDNPNAVAIIGGTPKGKNLFYELCLQAECTPGWELFRFTTYDNPVLRKSDIDALIYELGGPGEVVDQEIFGKFIDFSMFELFSYADILAAMNKSCTPTDDMEVWGVDVARHGADSSVIARRRGNAIYQLDKMRVPDTTELAERIADIYNSAENKPETIFIEATGIGWGVYDSAARLDLPVLPADTAIRASVPKVLNKRAEMYRNLRDFVRGGGALPMDERLKAGLAAVEYNIGEDGFFRLLPKENIRQRTGFSPDEADACALTFFAPVEPHIEAPPENLPTGNW